jgi:hypothetical protein
MLNDDILNHAIFNQDGLPDDESSFHNIETILADAGVTYPAKVTWEDPKPVVTIKYNKEYGVFTADGMRERWDSIITAYDSLDKRNVDIEFDESIRESPEVDDDSGLTMLGIKQKGTNFHRGLIGRVDSRPLDFNTYYSFLLVAKAWIADQDNWVLAYNFIQLHPVFWSCPRPEQYPHQWDFDSGHGSLWVAVSTNKDGPVVMMEHGSSVPPRHNHHYHDFRLDVWAPSFENGYVQMAQKVHKFFTLDGEERPDIEYQKTQLEVDIDDRLAAARKEYDF